MPIGVMVFVSTMMFGACLLYASGAIARAIRPEHDGHEQFLAWCLGLLSLALAVFFVAVSSN